VIHAREILLIQMPKYGFFGEIGAWTGREGEEVGREDGVKGELDLF